MVAPGSPNTGRRISADRQARGGPLARLADPGGNVLRLIG